jgi:uncharacterized SAM-dependent methyltransferase
MPAASVTIHPSQFPDAVRRDLLESLRTRRVNHKFHYDSLKQTQKWLALHEAFSPARKDTDCLDTYDRAFTETAVKISAKSIHILGLGCGGGQKDTRLLELLKASSREIFYTPCDVSVAMTLVARQTALAVVPAQNCFPFVCDLATAENLGTALVTRHPTLVTFFGMIPNFEPDVILPRLAALVRPEDYLLFSANLAPGPDYAAGMEKILPQYDNTLTRDWLLTFLDETGVGRAAGELRFTVEDGAAGLKRVVANFHFAQAVEATVDGEKFNFQPGEIIRLFFSYRHTPDRVEKLLAQHGLKVQAQWITQSKEEGVFLCRRE